MLSKFNLDAKVVILTGGAGLLGREYAHALTSAGAVVILADLNQQAAQAVADRVGARAHALAVDITQPASVEAMVTEVVQRFGRIDGLVNNAAVDPKFDPQHTGQHGATFETYPLALWNQSVAVNMTGMFLCCQAVAPTMLHQGHGVIVNVSSMYGLVGPDQRLYERDDPAHPVQVKPVTYTVTKSAVLGLTKYLATYWSNKGIRVNTLTLGGVEHHHDEDFLRRYQWRTPLQRMARPDEYNAALIFLLSEASSYMTGANLIIDGGWTAW